MGKKDDKKVQDPVVEPNEALLNLAEGGEKMEEAVTAPTIDLDELDRGVSNYQLGINRTGRSANSQMSRYRATLVAYLNYLEAKGTKRVEVGAVVHNFAVKVLGSTAAYRKSYNYLLNCIAHGHLPKGWKLDPKVEGVPGSQNCFVFVDQPEEPLAEIEG